MSARATGSGSTVAATITAITATAMTAVGIAKGRGGYGKTGAEIGVSGTATSTTTDTGRGTATSTGRGTAEVGSAGGKSGSTERGTVGLEKVLKHVGGATGQGWAAAARRRSPWARTWERKLSKRRHCHWRSC